MIFKLNSIVNWFDRFISLHSSVQLKKLTKEFFKARDSWLHQVDMLLKGKRVIAKGEENITERLPWMDAVLKSKQRNS